MINNTLDFYNNNSKSYIENTLSLDMSHLYKDFLKYIPKDGHILDLGCGSGRDSLEFIKKGYNVTAVDGSKELAIAASEIIGKEVICSKFEDLQLTESFHGIWACASLLHVNIDEKGRYFNCYTEKTFSEIINKVNNLKVEKIYKTIDILPGRGDITWLNILCIKVD